MVVDPVLGVRGGVARAEQPRGCSSRCRRTGAPARPRPARRRRRSSSSPRKGCSVVTAPSTAAELGPLGVDLPGPRVPVPGRGQDVQRVGVRAGVRDPDRHQQRRTGPPSRSRPRRSSSGRRRRCPCRAARTRGRACRARRSPRRAPRRGTRPAGSGSASGSTHGSGSASRYHQYSLASSPWLPWLPVRPKIRSLRIGSRPFQSASPRQSRCSTSEKPARPSSPQR